MAVDPNRFHNTSVRSGMTRIAVQVLTICLWIGGCWVYAAVAMNQVQVIGTHNSYHLEHDVEFLKLIGRKSPEAANALQYSHRPLPEQFSRLGVRQIELDIFSDPRGGLYSRPLGLERAREQGLMTQYDHDPEGYLEKPGMKVLHVQDIDFRSTVPTLIQALGQVEVWSTNHPRHVPIMVLLELKQGLAGAGRTHAVTFGVGELMALEEEILSVFEPGRIVKPDDVRGDFSTLRQAVLEVGWPELERVRGKVMFAMDNTDAVRDLYLGATPNLKGKLLFVSVSEAHPAAAWMKINDPVTHFTEIQRLVRAGFLVRTRADANTREARADDGKRREKALASGAQFVSTDYPEPNPAFGNYQVRFSKEIVVRTNPVNGDRLLEGKDLEAEK